MPNALSDQKILIMTIKLTYAQVAAGVTRDAAHAARGAYALGFSNEETRSALVGWVGPLQQIEDIGDGGRARRHVERAQGRHARGGGRARARARRMRPRRGRAHALRALRICGNHERTTRLVPACTDRPRAWVICFVCT